MNTLTKNGVPWIPTPMNSSAIGINNRGGYEKYMKFIASYGIDCIRIHIPGTVSQLCDKNYNLTLECRDWIQKIGNATKENGISLIAMPFPNEACWKYNPMSQNFSWLPDWWKNGLDASKKLLDNLQIEIAKYWDVAFWEVINEVHVRGEIETLFICDICDHVRQIQDAPVSVSFEQQDQAITPFGQQVIKHSDIVNAHTYLSPVNLSWYTLGQEKNEWRRLEKMITNVELICDTLKTAANGKPFLSSEDPLYPTWHPIHDFFRKIFKLPTNKDITQNFIDRWNTWLINDAAMPGITWSMAWGDYPDHTLEAIFANSIKE